MEKFLSALEGYDHIIWDWNGTLLNDVEVCIEIAGLLLADQNLPTPSVNHYREVFQFPVKEYYRALGFDFSETSFEELADLYHVHYFQRAFDAPLHEGCRDVLTAITAAGTQQSVLSAAQEAHLREIVGKFGLTPHFHQVLGLPDLLAVSKIERGLQLIAGSGVSADATLMIGDTDHDLEVGQEMGVDVLLIAHGHQSAERLRAAHDKVIPGFYH